MSSPLLTCQSLTRSYGSKELFRDIGLCIFSGDRVGVIGPNGSGKSTLLKILADIERQDQGDISKRRGLRVGYVPQESVMPDGTVFEALMAVEPNELEAKIFLSKLGFLDNDQLCKSLSGGWQKKLDLARALMIVPDILLLDEPTNHLDLESILWLENFLLKEVTTFMVTSHDRRFLERVTNRMMELNRAFPKGLFEAQGSFFAFLDQKELFLKGQLEYQKSLASKVRREEAWLKTTPQARTTKSRSRIDQAGELIQELAQVKSRNQERKLNIDFSTTDKESKKLISARGLMKSLGGRSLFSKIDVLLSPGTRLGITGPNGCGKSTLLKILGKEITADQGTVKYADNLKIVYFDQMRAQLPLHLTLKEALSANGEYVSFQGRPVHINTWGKKFFFEPNQLDMPLSQLSGGERARLIIARLMLQPADVLLLDEPTNDLDIDTLEVIEESLKSFPGAIVLITHDREMMERVSLEKIDLTPIKEVASKSPESKEKQDKTQRTPSNIKISFKDKFEYEKLGKDIVILEKEIADLTATLSHADMAHDHQQLSTLGQKLQEKEEALETSFFRWHELDNLLNP